jgi:hypothetical protein
MKLAYLLGAIVIILAVSAFFLINPYFMTSESGNEKKIEIRGIYGSPSVFWNIGQKLDHLGINAVFMHGKSINKNITARLKKERIKIFAEFPTLNGKGYVEKHPEAWAINENGEKVEAASWFMGVCPTEPGFKQYRINELRKLLEKFDLDGVWMDYLHWHAQFEDPEPILPETCFCDNCLATFQDATGIEIPDGSTKTKADWILKNQDRNWRDWRCSVITGWVRDIRKVLKQTNPDALAGLYHCPWDDDDFNGARRRILGLDYAMLKKHVDVFSPMVYHARMGRNPEWVKDNIEWFCQNLQIKADTFPKVWPIVQCYNEPYVISSSEFEKVLRYGMSSQATGIMMFTSVAVAEEQEKIEAMKSVYVKL